MAKPKSISLDEVPKDDMVICPECGVLFIKTVKGETWFFFERKGVYCPVCDTLVVKSEKPKKQDEDNSWI
jgi:uncharacterized Zn finger protein (UPF0148 family)